MKFNDNSLNHFDNYAEIYIWSCKLFGHTAVKITHNGTEEYCSLYSENPIDNSQWYDLFYYYISLIKTNGVFHTQEEDGLLDSNYQSFPARNENQYQFRTFTTHRLNTQNMIVAAQTIKKQFIAWRQHPAIDLSIEETLQINYSQSANINTRFFGIGRLTNSIICSELVYEILLAGGLHNLLPDYARFSNPSHLLYLTLRPPIAIAMLTPLAYSFLSAQHKQDSTAHLAEHLAFLGQMLIILIMEKILMNNVKIFGCTIKFPRTRRLVEICQADFMIQFIALYGFGLGGLIFRYYSLPINPSDQFYYSYGVDLILWATISSACYFVFGYCCWVLFYFCNGLRGWVRPQGIETIMIYLNETPSLNENLRSFYYQMESTLFIIPSAAILTTYHLWRCLSNSIVAFFLGNFLGTMGGYLITRFVQHRLTKHHFPASIPHDVLNSESLTTIHNSNLEQFALICSWTSAGIVSGTLFAKAWITNNVYGVGLCSILGALSAYLLGIVTHQNLLSGLEYNHSSFLKRWRGNNDTPENEIELNSDDKNCYRRLE